MSDSGRRTADARWRPDPTALIGAVLVVVTVGALLLVQGQEPADRTAAPTTTTLTSSSLGCPSALPGGEAVAVGTARGSVDGEVTVTSRGDERALDVASERVATLDEARPLAVTGTGDLAPGLLAARFGGGSLAAVDCPAPTPESWFTGVGAGARHDSVLELVNPDEGPAVADVTVYGRGGPLDVSDLRGVTVGGHDSLRLQLGEVMPRRSELALRVVVSRGRLSASLLDQVPELGARPLTEDWLPGQPAPTTSATLLGLPRGPGTDVLAVANPGDSEARVQVRILTTDSSFAPEGVEEVRVPPGSVRTVTLTSVVRAAVQDGAIGIEVTASAPVTSSLRTVVADDLSHAAPVLPSGEPTTVLVPQGTASVVLADAEGVGVATVSAWTADGKALEEQQVELKPGQGGVVDLPRGAALVRVTPRRTAVHSAVLVTGAGAGAAVVGFRELVTDALIPDVHPGLP